METKVKKQKTLQGIVSKLSSANTIKVRVESKQTHPKYGKVVMSHKQYLVHVANPNVLAEIKVGDAVTIGEIKPVSKMKTWGYIGQAKVNKK